MNQEHFNFLKLTFWKTKSLYASLKPKEALEILDKIEAQFIEANSQEEVSSFNFTKIHCLIQIDRSKIDIDGIDIEYNKIKDKNTKHTVEYLNILSQYYLEVDTVKAVDYCIQGLKIVAILNDKFSEFSYLGRLFYCFQKIDDPKTALEYFDNYYVLGVELGLYNRLMQSSRIAVMVSQKLNDNNKTEQYSKYGIEIAVKTNTAFSLSIAMDLLTKINKNNEAIEIANTIESRQDECNEIEQLTFLYNLGNTFFINKDYNKSLVTTQLEFSEF
jgi:hypothetical protein